MPQPNPFDLIRGLFRKSNPFKDLTAEEKKKQKQNEIAVKEGILQLGIICNDILSDQRYLTFANLYRDIEKRIIDAMIDLDEPDRDKYYLKMVEYQHRLRDFRNILKMPGQFTERAEEIKRTEVK